ncbi:hypothetical protein [Chitinophaga sancti]|uniref:TolB-like 6-blade propeller-like n=1 Tax=Chitinophaga sancti TaxID=1004 RepID=A0A1K1RNF7_9BACT|nr:hypothetical protein [Chitinophaga sancti]WQD62619.1 hypothetical protein U0033_32510 [Chitinophaga sancti]WQG91811.1 hypothetical protein SR876_09875 [Chitinophaga sancti]SFW73450.1 hypothetical protein SAMN05661012_04010 [Chitinophaga sancti]
MQSFVQFNLPIAYSFSNGLKVLETTIVNDDLLVVTFKESQQIVALNNKLELIWTGEPSINVGNYVYPRVAMREDGEMYAITDISSVKFYATDGLLLAEFPHEQWYSFLGTGCHFSGNKALFVTPSGGGDKLLVVSIPDFQILHEHTLDGYQEYAYGFHATSSPGIVLLDLAAGQDDTRLFSIRLLPGAIEVTELRACNDEIFGAFAPSGKEFVTAPHYDEGIKVFSFPGVEQIAEITQPALFEGRDEYPAANEDSLEYRVIYLDDEVLLTTTRFGRLLLIRRATMTCFGELLLEGNRLIPYNQRGAVAQEGEEIEDYEGQIGDTKLLAGAALLVAHRDAGLRVYELGNKLL